MLRHLWKSWKKQIGQKLIFSYDPNFTSDMEHNRDAIDFPERFNTKSLAVQDYSHNRSTDEMLRYLGYKLERQDSTKKISTSEKLRR